MKKDPPQWLPQQFVLLIVEINKLQPKFPYSLIDKELTHKLCEFSNDCELFWVGFNRLLKKHKIPESEQAHLFTTLLLSMQQGLSAKEQAWDQMNTMARQESIHNLISTIDLLEKQINTLMESNSPVLKALKSLEQSALCDEKKCSLQKIEVELKQTAVRRPFIDPQLLDMLTKASSDLESSLYLLNKEQDEAGSREIQLVPQRGKNQKVTSFVRVLARWFELHFGSPLYEHITNLCYILFLEELNENFDKDNVKSAIKRKYKVLK